jgi:MFS family permease
MIAVNQNLTRNLFNLTVIITSLGYFIDFFDMFLFNILRVKSLTDLRLSGDALTQSGLFISNCQYAGILLGAYLWGLLGDRVGRKRALFLSIIVYSLGSIASAFVQDVNMYGLARFITGLGIAGELGAGVTLILEGLRSEKRAWGVMVFISMGFLGALVAGLLVQHVEWRHAYIIGGGLGLCLLFLRILLPESGMYEGMEGKSLKRGGLSIILRDPVLLRRYVGAIFMMAPGVFVPQIIFTLSPELGKAMGIAEPIQAPIAVALGMGCSILGDLLGVYASERLKSRKKAVGLFLALTVVIFLKYLFWPAQSATEFYIWTALMGMVMGVWVIGATWAAEQFGVNIRATVATTVPNFARGVTIPMNLAYGALKGYGPLQAATIIGFTIFALAWIGWYFLSETWGRDLDYYEEPQTA